MGITKEQIQIRIRALQQQAEKLQNDLNATLGAIQDCNFWIAQLAVEEKKDESV
jgi:hypothetical protein